MTHPLRALCQVSYSPKCAAKTAGPVLPMLNPETAGCLQSIMPTPISHAWMQGHPKAARWIPGPQANVPAGRWVVQKSMNSGL